MANIINPTNPEFPDVYLIDVEDDVLGGEDGTANRQAMQLVERTAFLKKALDLLEQKRNEVDYSIGSDYVQRPNSLSPVGKGLPGDWEEWTFRAETYGLSASMPIASPPLYAGGGNYAVNAYVLWSPTTGDRWIHQAKAAISGAPATLDPVAWNRYTPNMRVDRRLVQPGDGGWQEPDLAIGYQIASGPYAGMYVTEVNTVAGKFFSMDGGNRPTYGSGGVQGDRIRNITGGFEIRGNGGDDTGVLVGANNVFSYSVSNRNSGTVTLGATIHDWHMAIFDSSRVVPTGLDVAGINLSCRYWRRVA